MSETLTKLRPDRDLQCYFQQPSAIAALSETSSTGFTLSGSWRQQFDWAVVEWNRDNVFEHPQLRNLPDGDLSGITLSYTETRDNCIPLDSTISATVPWPSLRIWADKPDPYEVPLANYTTTPAAGTPASATFTLCGNVSPGDLVQLLWEDEHYYTTMNDGDDTLALAANRIAYAINQSSKIVTANVDGAAIKLTVNSSCAPYAGSNGNRLGAYGTVSGIGGTAYWSPASQYFTGGQSALTRSFTIPFGYLYCDAAKTQKVPTNNVRMMRWTYAADLQPGAYQRQEFSVIFTNWTVTGSGLTYSVAGPGSRRIEDSSTDLLYSTNVGPDWFSSSGNFSAGTITSTDRHLATCTYEFNAGRTFDVYIGTRRGSNCAVLTATLDGVQFPPVDLNDGMEDFLVRLPAGTVQPGNHTLVIQHTGGPGTCLWLDFIDLAVPTGQLPTFEACPSMTLATDWDTNHSIALAPERTAWLINQLGFTGRANHYAGALWFYELVRAGHSYATATIQFGGVANAGDTTTLSINFVGSTQPATQISHKHWYGDTTETVAKALELRINSGYTAIWATASATTLTIQSRMMGAEGNSITVGVTTGPSMMAPAFLQLSGGVDGAGDGIGDILAAAHPLDPDWTQKWTAYAATNRGWRTDPTATHRINRAARDWSRSFFKALKSYGIEVTAAFSTELQHGDPSTAAGIAQRYPSGTATVVTTPALQTNFSPKSLAFWQQTYADMAQIMVDAGQKPYLQFGEVQWWYFADDGSGLPFYDDYTKSQFAAKYNRPIDTIISNTVDPASYPQVAEFLPSLIGAFTLAIQEFVRQSQPAARFEVLYPCDTNNYPFTAVANLPVADWTTSTLDCFKTENFSFTDARNLELARGAVTFPSTLGFTPSRSSHLVGISDPTAPWQQEAAITTNAGLESVVLFALDQYCLIGYQWQSWRPAARSFMIP